MHYYKRNIGDYAKKAGRLTMLQHGSYTLLIDACYDRERFPTKDEAIEWTWACTSDEIAAVEFVLSRFFVLEDGRYVQHRIQEEIDQYRVNAETNKRIAIERETNRKSKSTNRAPIVDEPSRSENEPPPNHKPLTTNHKPIKNPSSSGDEGFGEFWLNYPRKDGRKAALKAYEKIRPDDALRAKIISAVVAWKKTQAWLKEGGQYVPHAATWLNGERWNDEIPNEPPPQASRSKETSWWTSDQAILKKANELGMSIRAGESWQDLRGRINQKLEAVA